MSDNDDMDMESDGEFASGSEPEVLSDEDWKEELPVLEQQKSFQVWHVSADRVLLHPRQVMAKKDVIQQSRELIEGVREVLSLSSSAAAAALLRHFKWNKERLLEAYMRNPEKTLKEIGMGSLALEVPPPSRPVTFSCAVCLEEVPMTETFALGCGHRYCKQCWTDFLEVHVAAGANCVYTQCMHPGCTELCHEECFQKLVRPAVVERYREFLHRSFIDHNPNVKWCPRPGCDNSVSCDRRGRRQPVLCACGFEFCFQCADLEIGNHLPASCASVKAWVEKSKDESENVKWMMANCLSDDMQVLTSKGFMFYHEAKSAYAAGELVVMQYEPTTGCLEAVVAQDLIYNDSKDQQLVEVTDARERKRWGSNEDAARGGVPKADGGSRCGVSVLVTPEHDMYVRGANFEQRDHNVAGCYRDQASGFAKVAAGSLLSNDSSSGYRMVSAVRGVLARTSLQDFSFARALNLQSATEVAAALRLYGLWLAHGSLIADAVCFANLGSARRLFLAQQLRALRLGKGVDFRESGRGVVEVTCRRFVDYFVSEYGCDGSKWCWDWIWTLPTVLLDCVVEGVHAANGYDDAAPAKEFRTSSMRLRDDVLRMCVLAGYNAYFYLDRERGGMCGTDVGGSPIVAERDRWVVHHNSNAILANPIVRSSTDVQLVDYRSFTWCVSVPTGLILVRRASALPSGEVVKASRTIVVGNCKRCPKCQKHIEKVNIPKCPGAFALFFLTQFFLQEWRVHAHDVQTRRRRMRLSVLLAVPRAVGRARQRYWRLLRLQQVRRLCGQEGRSAG